MLIFIYILIALIAITLSILFLNINITLSFDEKIKIKLRILFVRLDLLKFLEKRQVHEKLKQTEKKVEKDINASEKRKNTLEDFFSFLELIKDIASKMAVYLSKKLKVNLKKLEVKIGSDQAEKTAMLYGKISSAIYILCETLPQIVTFKKNYKNIGVYSDFTSENCTFKIKVMFTIKVWHILKIALDSLAILKNNAQKRIKKRSKSNERHTAETDNRSLY